MENRIDIFKNPSFGEVRVAKGANGEPLFVAGDIAKALGYVNPRKAVIDHCKGVTKRDTLTEGGMQSLSFIPEFDVYRLILRSKLPQAEQFQDWVVEEVLPAIRKTGGYIIAKEEDTPEIIMARAVLVANETIEKQNKVLAEKERQIKLKEEFIQLQAPKIDYYNQVLSSTNGHTLTTIAAMYRMSAITLNRVLMMGKVIRKTGKEYSITAKYQAENIAKLEKFSYVNSKGENCVKNDLRWTEKGHEVIDGIIKRAIAAGALKEVKGRYMIDHKWIKNLNTKQSCTK